MNKKEVAFSVPTLLISFFFAIMIVPQLDKNPITFLASLTPFIIVIIGSLLGVYNIKQEKVINE